MRTNSILNPYHCSAMNVKEKNFKEKQIFDLQPLNGQGQRPPTLTWWDETWECIRQLLLFLLQMKYLPVQFYNVALKMVKIVNPWPKNPLILSTLSKFSGLQLSILSLQWFMVANRNSLKPISDNIRKDLLQVAFPISFTSKIGQILQGSQERINLKTEIHITMSDTQNLPTYLYPKITYR